MIQGLISQIINGSSFIKNENFCFPELILALKELDELAELDNIKDIICDQIRAYIFSLLMSDVSSNNFHTILCGSPGVGKTTVAKSICKIFRAMGILKLDKDKKRYHTSSLNDSLKKILNELYDYYNISKNIPDNIVKKLWEEVKKYISTEEIKEIESEIVICGREDFVAGFSGQSALKTSEFLKKNLGKCVIIEEAYLLWTGENDGYGMESLTVLNRFMDEYQGKIIIIMTGYKDMLFNTIFKAQPGLRRRFQWMFELKEYSPQGLSTMFVQQMNEDGWKISPDIDLVQFFTENYNSFPYFGGDTKRFSWTCKAIHSAQELDKYIQYAKDGISLPIPELSSKNFYLAFNEYLKITIH